MVPLLWLLFATGDAKRRIFLAPLTGWEKGLVERSLWESSASSCMLAAERLREATIGLEQPLPSVKITYPSSFRLPGQLLLPSGLSKVSPVPEPEL